MSLPPQPPNYGELIELRRMTIRPKLSVRAAAKEAQISDTRWRQIVRGYQPAGDMFIPVAAPPGTLARMAAVVGVSAPELEALGQSEAAEELRLWTRNEDLPLSIELVLGAVSRLIEPMPGDPDRLFRDGLRRDAAYILITFPKLQEAIREGDLEQARKISDEMSDKIMLLTTFSIGSGGTRPSDEIVKTAIDQLEQARAVASQSGYPSHPDPTLPSMAGSDPKLPSDTDNSSNNPAAEDGVERVVWLGDLPPEGLVDEGATSTEAPSGDTLTAPPRAARPVDPNPLEHAGEESQLLKGSRRPVTTHPVTAEDLVTVSDDGGPWAGLPVIDPDVLGLAAHKGESVGRKLRDAQDQDAEESQLPEGDDPA